VSLSEEKDPILKQPSRVVLLRLLPLASIFLCWMNGCRPSSANIPVSLNGRWTGSGVYRGRTIPSILDFYAVPGGWRAFGGKAGLPNYLFAPVSNIRYQHPQISFEMKDGHERVLFEGTVSDKVIKAVSRGQEQAILELKWSGDAPPLQFTEETIEFRNGEVKLGGDLLLPAGPGPHPAIILIHGSGRATRDDLRIFASLFVTHGVAALLYDKRDVGADPSGMDLVDHHDLAGDAVAAVALLKSREDIRGDQIGLWGASQGSWVAAIAAAQSADIAFVIAVSAAGVSSAEMYRSFQEFRLRSHGFSNSEVLEATSALRRLDDFVRSANPQGAQPILSEARRKRWFEFSTLPYSAPTEAEMRTWVRWRNLDLDPTTYWARVKIPVLLIFGEREDRAPVNKSVSRIREAFRRAGNTKYTIKIFPGANHSIIIAPDVGAGERRSVEANEGLPFAPGYLDTMTGWLREQLRLQR
jgi:pimeloyl-ACP methyl ester carboxylesterase